jgi:hypothetical protein
LTLLAFLVYLIRAASTSFKNQTVNYILLLASGYLVYLSKMVVILGLMISSLTKRANVTNSQGFSVEPPYGANTEAMDNNTVFIGNISGGINHSIWVYRLSNWEK